MSIVDALPLERSDALEDILAQRFAHRAKNRALRLLGRQRRYGPISNLITGNQEADRAVCLGGLEVKYVSASTVQVSAGSLLLTNPDPITEARPASYDPVPAEADDDTYCTADLVVAANVAPTVPISGTTSGHEWWVVYGDVEEIAVEDDTNRKVFDEDPGSPTGGQFIDTDVSAQGKIYRTVFTPKVARGAPAESIDSVISALTSEQVVIGWISVPTGSANLSTSRFYDARPLPGLLGPNRIWGQGKLGWPGTDAVTPPVAPASSSEVFAGQFGAQIDGRIISASIAEGAGLSALKIKSPNSTWNAAATLDAPSLVYLYLMSVSEFYPVLTAIGSSPIGNGAATNETVIFSGGVLVLSSVAPTVAVPATGASVKAGGRYDLRPSASIELPRVVIGGVNYEFGSCFGNHGLCIAALLAVGYDGVNDAPILAGPAEVSPDGWIGYGLTPTSGPPVPYIRSTGYFSAFTISNVDSLLTVTATPVALAGGALPITGVRFNIVGQCNAATMASFTEAHPKTGKRYPIAVNPASTPASAQEVVWDPEVEITPQKPSAIAIGAGVVGVDVFNVVDRHICAVRWPYNTPLAT